MISIKFDQKTGFIQNINREMAQCVALGHCKFNINYSYKASFI